MVVDTDHQVADRQPASIEVPISDIKIEGDGTSVIEAADTNQSGDILRIEDKENVWIDNLIIDAKCGEGRRGDARNIGGQEVGTLRNIRITNCVLRNAGRDAIVFENDDVAGDLTDFYIAGNTINFSDNHGILLGVYDNAGPSTIKNVIYENNKITDTDIQAIGVFAVGSNASGENILMVDNVVNQPPATDEQGANHGFETNISYALAYANEINSYRAQAGISITKGGTDCIAYRNKVRGGGRAVWIDDRKTGPPITRHNLVVGNDNRNANHGVWYGNIDGDLQVSDNYLTGNGNPVTDGGGNTGSNYKIFNNGTGVGTADTGLPSSIQNPISITDSNGDTVGAASWDRGSPHPDDPVRVAVSVDLGGNASV